MFAALALGSNLGDRFQNIERALRHLEALHTLRSHLITNASESGVGSEREHARRKDAPDEDANGNAVGVGAIEDEDLEVVATSFLYETAPMYVTDQPAFVNCACLVSCLGVLKEENQRDADFSNHHYRTLLIFPS